MIGQLDKCIREASTLDGVLEFRHEHFWTVAFDKMVTISILIKRVKFELDCTFISFYANV